MDPCQASVYNLFGQYLVQNAVEGAELGRKPGDTKAQTVETYDFWLDDIGSMSLEPRLDEWYQWKKGLEKRWVVDNFFSKLSDRLLGTESGVP